MRIVVITGLSGAGKTQVLHALEDARFYCVDNLPTQLVAQTAELIRGAHINGSAALGVDARSGVLFDARTLLLEIDRLRQRGDQVDVLFVECGQDALISRYKETRREHPLGIDRGSSITDGIRLESAMLKPLRDAATHILDTTNLSVRSLTRWVTRLYAPLCGQEFAIDLFSFGYKRGLPREADIVMDMRFLPNPFYVKELRPLTGLNDKVYDYVMAFPAAQAFVDAFAGMINTLVPLYEEEGRLSLAIGIGCTGGQHRSVSIARALADKLKKDGRAVSVTHRDI